MQLPSLPFAKEKGAKNVPLNSISQLMKINQNKAQMVMGWKVKMSMKEMIFSLTQCAFVKFHEFQIS